ncbi:ApeP family dehydratase [Thalassotalea fusca]
MHNYSLEQLISHREPMVLISGLQAYDSEQAHGWVDISADSPFYNQELGGVPSYIGIEYMAQTIAAFAGANALDNNQEVKIGFLLGSRKFQTEQSVFCQGTRLDIFVEQLYQEPSGLSVFDCKITHNNKIIAQAKVNTFQPDDASAIIEE